MKSPKRLRLDDEALRRFAEGRFNARAETQIAIAIEQPPELQARLAAISGVGLLDRVREIASQSRAEAEGSRNQAVQRDDLQGRQSAAG